jgi:hypothetical protein
VVRQAATTNLCLQELEEFPHVQSAVTVSIQPVNDRASILHLNNSTGATRSNKDGWHGGEVRVRVRALGE